MIKLPTAADSAERSAKASSWRLAALVLGALNVLLLLALLSSSAPQALAGESSPTEKGPATAMAGLEGETCPDDEYERYKTIVCKVEESCNCADTKCALEWCAEYVHNWNLEFGACAKKGCP